MSKWEDELKWGWEGREAYLERIASLDRGRGQTCVHCDATDSELTCWQNGFAHYRCNNCGRNFAG